MTQINLESSKTLYLDCSSGISGDMTVAALLDLDADRTVLEQALASLKLEGYRIEISDVIKHGLRACDFNVILDTAHENHDHDMAYLHGSSSVTPHDHGHAHETHDTTAPHTHTHHHGRNLGEITDLLSSGSLTPNALRLALQIFQIVAEAESTVHGKPLNEVHFHEVGAIDSIIDIAAVAVCMDNLGIEQVIIPALTEGSGTVRCQHGLLPVPVPAVTAIVTAHQLPLRISQVQGELVTPTGAAIAAALRTSDKLPEEFKILRTGLGAGKRNYETSGILRAMLIETTKVNYDHILILETNIDDCTGEALGYTMEELLEAGALDVFYTPVYMKKHRPGYQLNVMCTEETRKTMETLIFRHTTTIGIRMHEVQRTKLPRRIVTLETPWGMADVKCCTYENETYCYPENDSIRRLADSHQMSFTEMYHKVKEFASSTN